MQTVAVSCRPILYREEVVFDYGVVIPKNSTGTVECHCGERKCRRWVY